MGTGLDLSQLEIPRLIVVELGDPKAVLAGIKDKSEILAGRLGMVPLRDTSLGPCLLSRPRFARRSCRAVEYGSREPPGGAPAH